MSKIVVVGESPLALLIADLLDQDVARQTHHQVIFVSEESTIPYLPCSSPMAAAEALNKTKLLRHVSLVKDSVKSVNLRSRQLILSRRIIQYDYLILDRTPSLKTSELKEIVKSINRLATHLQAKARQGQTINAKIICAGQSSTAFQLALSLKARLKQLKLHNVVVEADLRGIDPALKSYLKDEGIVTISNELDRLPTLRLQLPELHLKTATIKGLPVDNRGYARTEATGNVSGYKNAWVVDGAKRRYQNIWRSEATLAQEYVMSLERRLEALEPKALPRLGSALLLGNRHSTFYQHGSIVSRRIRAAAVRQLDRYFFRRLLKRSVS